jgi:hypothetical protein
MRRIGLSQSCERSSRELRPTCGPPSSRGCLVPALLQNDGESTTICMVAICFGLVLGRKHVNEVTGVNQSQPTLIATDFNRDLFQIVLNY